MPSLARPAMWTIHFKNTKQDTGLRPIRRYVRDVAFCRTVTVQDSKVKSRETHLCQPQTFNSKCKM